MGRSVCAMKQVKEREKKSGPSVCVEGMCYQSSPWLH